MKIKKIKTLIYKFWKHLFFVSTDYLYEYTGISNYLNKVADVRIVSYDNVNDAKSFQSDNYIEAFKKHLTNGVRGYYAYINGICCHRSWVFTNQMAINPFISLPLKENQVYIGWCATAENTRGKGIYPQVLSTIVRDYADKEIFIVANSKNIASQKGIEKAGFKIKGICKVIVVFGIKKKDYTIIKGGGSILELLDLGELKCA